VSGTITELGDKVHSSLAVGDRVLAVLPAFGGMATEVVARQTDCFKLPPGVELVPAAGLAVAFGTAHVALAHRCGVQAGSTVLVLGAAGGVGLAAVQVAKALGARVAAVARGTAKCAALQAEGADLVVDTDTLAHTHKGGLKAVLAGFAPRGVDCIFDPVGGRMLSDALKAAAWGCQIAIIGFASGSVPQLPSNVLLVKNISAHGIYWGSYAKHQPQVLTDSLATLCGWAAIGKVRVRVSHRVPLERAHEAFRALMQRHVIGKVVIVMPDSATGTGNRARL
jgi:NADPH2:quinone reductase